MLGRSVMDWLNEDDSEGLGAALSLVDAWEDYTDVLSDNGDEPQAQEERGADAAALTAADARKAAREKTPRPRRINITRVRRKAEAEKLREESDALLSKLLTLQQQREAALKAHYDGTCIQSRAPIWESMARRQLQARKRSEEINAKLRRKAANQELVAHDLMKAVQVAIQRQTLEERLPTLRLPIDVSQRMSEEEQLERLRDNVAKWQWALSLSTKFERGELQFRDYKLIEMDAKAALLDVYTSFAFPYPVEQVAALVWSIFHKDSSGSVEDDEEVVEYVAEQQTSEHQIIAVFSMESTIGGCHARQGTISGKWVSQHEALPGNAQHLIISQWHSELEGFGPELDDVSVDEDKWVRVVDATQIGHPHLREPLAVLQHVRRVRIRFNRRAAADNRQIKAVTELVKQEIESDLQFVERNMESTLLDQALKMESQSRPPWLPHL